jgi:hypothetical protein
LVPLVPYGALLFGCTGDTAMHPEIKTHSYLVVKEDSPSVVH